MEGHKRRLDFRDDQYFDGRNLSRALNRDMTSGAVSLREALTPLTTFVVKTEYQEDRFEFSPLKDANGLAILPGFELDPAALISGKVFVGYRHFDALDPAVPDYRVWSATWRRPTVPTPPASWESSTGISRIRTRPPSLTMC